MKGTGDANSRLVYSTGAEAVESKNRGRGSTRETARPPGPGIRLRLERRASDRRVTVVSGLRGSEKEMEALARALKSACGAGGTVKDGVLELQGDHRDTVAAALVARGLKSRRAGG